MRCRYIRIDDPDESFWGWIDTETRQYIIDGAAEELFYNLTWITVTGGKDEIDKQDSHTL